MPRKPRLQAAGLPVHIIQRGNNRQACFFADEDYFFFLDHLAKLGKRFHCSLHAYVLMTNHFHLLLSSGLANGPSLLMKFLGQRYVQYVNRMYKRSGSLWEGRFRSSPVQTQHYVLGCYRYIEMNPVRANMVKHPGDYRWSSYAANAQGKKVEWLSPHGEYLALGADETRRLESYRGLFAADLDPELLREIRSSTHGGYAVGDSLFRQEIENAVNRRATPRAAGRPAKSTQTKKRA